MVQYLKCFPIQKKCTIYLAEENNSNRLYCSPENLMDTEGSLELDRKTQFLLPSFILASCKNEEKGWYEPANLYKNT